MELVFRSINELDLSILRKWKNDNREAFFYKDEISEEDQDEWYRNWNKYPDDYMFIIENDSIPIGCVAVRFINKEWDIYNVILGEKRFAKQGVMSMGLKVIIGIALDKRIAPVRVRVLRGNPVVDWYKKNGFIVTLENFGFKSSNHYVMTYQGET